MITFPFFTDGMSLTGVNLALKKQAYQSSVYNNHNASFAVGENKKSKFVLGCLIADDNANPISKLKIVLEGLASLL